MPHVGPKTKERCESCHSIAECVRSENTQAAPGPAEMKSQIFKDIRPLKEIVINFTFDLTGVADLVTSLTSRLPSRPRLSGGLPVATV